MQYFVWKQSTTIDLYKKSSIWLRAILHIVYVVGATSQFLAPVFLRVRLMLNPICIYRNQWTPCNRAKLSCKTASSTYYTWTCIRVPDEVHIFISIMSISSPNPMFDHLLESSHQDDSNKWPNIGFGEEVTLVELIEVNFIWSSVYVFIYIATDVLFCCMFFKFCHISHPYVVTICWNCLE